MIQKLSEKVSVSTQITTDDLKEIAGAGVTTLICNRPDGEEPDQPTMKEIKVAAATAQQLHGGIGRRSSLSIRTQRVLSFARTSRAAIHG